MEKGLFELEAGGTESENYSKEPRTESYITPTLIQNKYYLSLPPDEFLNES
jgi:hypothetical protein